MGWQGNNVFPLLIVNASGGFTGFFVYSPSPARGNLVVAIAAANGTDPYGNAYFGGLGTYAPDGGAPVNSRCVNLLSVATATIGFFQYNNPSGGAQGALILAVAAVGGNDPVTAHGYVAGLNGIDPVFGDVLQAVGSTLSFLIGATFTQAGRVQPAAGSGATPPNMAVFAPEQGQSGHVVLVVQGTSPDGTQLGQLLIAREPTGFTLPVRATSKPIVEIQSDDLAISTAGHGLLIKEGSNARLGTATLVGGTVIVPNTSVTAATRVLYARSVAGGTLGHLSRTISVGVSFTINSTSGTDTSQIAWMLVDPA